MSHSINVFDGDAMLREFLGDMAVNLARLETAGMMPRAVAVREDLWPGMTTAHGYPVFRLALTSPVPWGVLV